MSPKGAENSDNEIFCCSRDIMKRECSVCRQTTMFQTKSIRLFHFKIDLRQKVIKHLVRSPLVKPILHFFHGGDVFVEQHVHLERVRSCIKNKRFFFKRKSLKGESFNPYQREIQLRHLFEDVLCIICDNSSIQFM